MVKRILGLKRLPDVSTVSRSLAAADEKSVGKVRNESRRFVLERLAREGFSRVTLDYDGSVLSTGRHAEGTAVGFNRKRKGARSYYPLFCTIVQTDQVLDVHHRPGNPRLQRGRHLHQSLYEPNTVMPSPREDRNPHRQRLLRTKPSSNYCILRRPNSPSRYLSSAFPFSRIWLRAEKNGAGRGELITSKHVGSRSGIPAIASSSSENGSGTNTSNRSNSPVPTRRGYEFKVIVTNKRTNPCNIVAFHEGRGSQEGILAELKTHCQMDYIPVRTRVGNQLYMFAGILAHNLTRELQIQIDRRARGTTPKRAALWCFREMETLRRTLIRAPDALFDRAANRSSP